MWDVLHMKQVVILQGVSGSGKSTYAQNLIRTRPQYTVPLIVSADDYFYAVGNGNYAFDRTKLANAHATCLYMYMEAVQGLNGRVDMVVVDNTNTSVYEVAPYVAIAVACGFDVEIHRVVCNPSVAALRNVHGVPPRAIDRMASNIVEFDRQAPSHWPKVNIVKESC